MFSWLLVLAFEDLASFCLDSVKLIPESMDVFDFLMIEHVSFPFLVQTVSLFCLDFLFWVVGLA